MFRTALLPVVLTAAAAASAQDAGRAQIRLLYSFENPGEAAQLLRFSDSVALDVVADNGVTEGARCARLTAAKGAPFAGIQLGSAAVKDWRGFDYFAVDVFTDDEHPYEVALELWDAASRNYATRCTFEGAKTRAGRQTLMWRINRAKRNGKEGRDWEELQPADKIDMAALTRVKIFLTPRRDRDAVLWIDNLRLMQEDAAKPKMRVALPAGATGFDFGGGSSGVAGFRAVPPDTAFTPERGYGFASTQGLVKGGEGWPDALAGTFVAAPPGRPIEFRARVPDGRYLVWIAAGKIIRPDLPDRRFRLRVGDAVLCDELPTVEELHSGKYLYRFLETGYSEKPDALWRRYIDRMYPSHTAEVTVSGGVLTVEAVNHFLSGLILVPAAEKPAFTAMAEAIAGTRREAFAKTCIAPRVRKPVRRPGDGDFLLYVPDPAGSVGPHTGPSEAERRRNAIAAAGAPGQRIVMRLAVTPFADLGRCALTVSDLTGPGTIPASAVRGYFSEYRSDGRSVSESHLVPRLDPEIESGVSRCFWLWMKIPDDAPAGRYAGRLAFRTAAGASVEVPVSLEVYTLRLEPVLPLSLGMYWHERNRPPYPEATRRRHLREQLEWMREIGFTAVALPPPAVVGVEGGRVRLRFDPTVWEVAREVGMGRHPEQACMANSLGVARGIARRLPGSAGAKVDQQPGLELRQREFAGLYLDAMRQYADLIAKQGLPVAMEVVDEPREVPNPWNRNLADTIAYADLLHRVPGIRTFVTPMGDSNSGKDYTVLLDHVDIMSTHAWKGSQRLLEKTRAAAPGKTLWLYNTGMDRLSWGFYNHRAGSRGRWEWHFCFAEDTAVGGYPGREWYNPFTGLHGAAPNAPEAAHRGGFLFQSAFLQVAEGINDAAYLHTLQESLKASGSAGRNPEAVKAAEAFLASLQKAIPLLPDVKGLHGDDAGALVGRGLVDAARHRLDEWRGTWAELIFALRR